MRKFIYQSVVEKLQQEIPEIAHFGLWNNQLTYIEGEVPFELPAVFVEFRTIRWQHQGNGVRDAAVEIVLHTLTEAKAKKPLQFFDLLTDINRALHKHVKVSDYYGHNAFTAIQSTTDHNFGEIRHDIEVFSCNAQDCSAMEKPKKVKATVKILT